MTKSVVTNSKNIYKVTRCPDSIPIIQHSTNEITNWVYEGVYLPGTFVKYSCNTSYTMVPDSFVGAMCDEYGTWFFLPVGTMGSCFRC